MDRYWVSSPEVKEDRIMKPWDGQCTAASRITWVHEADSASASFQSYAQSLIGQPCAHPRCEPMFYAPIRPQE